MSFKGNVKSFYWSFSNAQRKVNFTSL